MSRRGESTQAVGLWTADDVARCPITVIKGRDDGSPRVTLVDHHDGRVVVKEWDPPGRVLGWWARLNQRRELRHYQALLGVRGVPRLVAQVSDHAFALQYVEGEPIHRRMSPERLRSGLDSLERTVQELHARRFVHMDLHQKKNVIIDAAGEAWVVDLGQGLDCRRGLFRRLFFPLLKIPDHRAVLKFRARYAPDSLANDQRDKLVSAYGQRSFRRHIKPFRRWLRRALLGRDD